MLFGRWGMRLNIRTFWIRPIRHRPARSLERTHFSLSHLSFDLRRYFVRWTQHLCLPTLASKNQYRYPRISSLNATPPAWRLLIIGLSSCPWPLVEHKLHLYWFSDELLSKSQLHGLAITLSVLLRLSIDPKPAEKFLDFSLNFLYLLYKNFKTFSNFEFNWQNR